MLETFGLDTMRSVGGGAISVAFGHALEAAVRDIADRPEISTCRRVELVVELSPEEVQRGVVQRISTGFTINTKIPKKSSPAYSMRLATADEQGPQLMFNSESPDNPDQMTLDQVMPAADPPNLSIARQA